MGRLRLREYSVSPFQLLYRKSEKFRRAAYAFVRMFVVPRNRCNFKLNLALPFTGGISAIHRYSYWYSTIPVQYSYWYSY